MPHDTFAQMKAFVRLMEQRGCSPKGIAAYERLYQQYRAGDTGKVPWDSVAQPEPQDVVDFSEVATDEHRKRGQTALDQLVVIRLNGGLGTTMKLSQTKSLLPISGELNFLEISARQILELRRRFQVPVPWLLMNSPMTRQETLAALERPELQLPGLPLFFVQNLAPRIDCATQGPTQFADPDANWAPPGHGDIYLSFADSGLLQQLLDRGIRWAFVSNVDNLAATVDPAILGFLEARGADFAMEVARKTRADKKGGTLIRKDGHLSLLEVAQVGPQHLEEFKDIGTFSVFNSNNIWWRLDALQRILQEDRLQLPLIVNQKRIEGVDLVQLETAMGAAVACFDHPVGIQIPRSRFAPVKATSDLLAVRSDAYLLDDSWGIRPNPQRDPASGPPLIDLDERYFKSVDEMEARIPESLSLVECQQLVVQGDFSFGENVRIRGTVQLYNDSGQQQHIPDNTVLTSGAHRY